jgi:predicted  nucleic acid-binding Zn-ribbon protein
MTNPERAELDILRAEKSRWETLREEDRAERARILQEVNDLRSQVSPPVSWLIQNAEMVENHTRDLLQMKAKETQLARSRNDAELTQAALSKAQRDLEALRQASQTDTAKEIETYKFRAEKAEQRILEREELDQNVLSRLTDLEEFIRGLDDEYGDAQSVSRISSRAKDVEDQNRRLLSQLEEYASRITTLEEVHPTIVPSVNE